MTKKEIKNYAQALALVLEDKNVDEKRIIKNFIKLLEKKNKIGKAKKILKLTQEILLKKRGGKRILLEIARELDKEKKKLILDLLAGKEDIIEEKINPFLVAGIKISINDERQLDMSLIKKLEDLFIKI